MTGTSLCGVRGMGNSRVSMKWCFGRFFLDGGDECPEETFNTIKNIFDDETNNIQTEGGLCPQEVVLLAGGHVARVCAGRRSGRGAGSYEKSAGGEVGEFRTPQRLQPGG